MPSYFLATVFSGEASIKHSFLAAICILILWSAVSLLCIAVMSANLTISSFVTLVNMLFFTWGGLAIYSASLISHAISGSFIARVQKLFARFFNFILLLCGIIVIIGVTSGEVSWIIYLSKGVNSGLH